MTTEAPALGIRTTVLFGGFVVAAFFGGFGAWAALAPLDAAAIAPGVVLVEGKRKAIQHLEGGIVSSILVQEGAAVTAGQTLVQLEETQASARLEVLRAQLVAATALEARLVAERDRAETIAFPAWLATADEPAARDAVAGQQRIFDGRRQSLLNQVAILFKRIAQLQEEVAGLRDEIAAQDVQLALVAEETADIQTLVARGLARKPRLLALQRQHADIAGERARNRAAIARAEQTVGETKLQIEELHTSRLNEIVQELREVQTALEDLRERVAAAQDVLRRMAVVAPVDGTVVNLQVFTSGGVIAPGQEIMEIVPREQGLVVEARVDPNDIDTVYTGLPAQIRFPAFSQRAAPVFDGTVVHVSADRLEDERTGEGFYIATVRPDATPDEAYALQPGMAAEVMIVTGVRTPLDYFTSPIRASLAKAMTEP